MAPIFSFDYIFNLYKFRLAYNIFSVITNSDASIASRNLLDLASPANAPTRVYTPSYAEQFLLMIQKILLLLLLLRIILTMGVLLDDSNILTKIEYLVDKKVRTRSTTSLSLKILKEELTRRFIIIKEHEDMHLHTSQKIAQRR